MTEITEQITGLYRREKWGTSRGEPIKAGTILDLVTLLSVHFCYYDLIKTFFKIGCKYGKSEHSTRGDCNEKTNTQSLTLTLKSGDPQTCAQTWTVNRKCKKGKMGKPERNKREQKAKRQQRRKKRRQRKRDKSKIGNKVRTKVSRKVLS